MRLCWGFIFIVIVFIVGAPEKRPVTLNRKNKSRVILGIFENLGRVPRPGPPEDHGGFFPWDGRWDMKLPKSDLS